MRRLIWIPICFFALLIPVVVLAGGGQGGFDGVVNTLESRYHAHATRIPFLGLVSLVTRKATHEGVAGLHVAEFEHFSADVDGNELNQIVEENSAPAGSASFAKPTVTAASRPSYSCTPKASAWVCSF